MSKPFNWIKYSFIYSKYLFIVFLCFIGYACIAQETEEESKPTSKSGRRIRKEITWVEKGDVKLRWQPLGLINTFDMNFTAGSEIAYAKNKSFSLDVGYVFASVYGRGLRGEDPGGIPGASGFVIRPSHRFYISKYDGWFFDVAATYKDVTYKNQPQWVGRNVVNGVPAFQELTSFNSKKQIFLFDAMVGIQENLDRKKNFNFEMWIGLGIRVRDFYAELPPNSILLGNDRFQIFNFGPIYGKFVMPNIPAGLRLNYKIK